MDEVSFALKEKKVIIPVIYKDCRIPLRLHRLHYADCRKDYDSGLREVLKALAKELLKALAPEQEAGQITPTILDVQSENKTDVRKSSHTSAWRKPWSPNPGNLLVCNRKGKPMQCDKVTYKLQATLAALGIPKGTPHSFRHMVASELLNRRVSPYVVQRQLRHSDSKTTMERYAHFGYKLPRVLDKEEAELVLKQPNIDRPLGLRDRALLEVLYSSGLRRMEILKLKLYDLDKNHGVLAVREGKGRRDRIVPIGERALAWLERYLVEVRPSIVGKPDEGYVFLSSNGKQFAANYLSWLVRRYVRAAGPANISSFLSTP